MLSFSSVELKRQEFISNLRERERERQTDRQTDRQREREREKERERERQRGKYYPYENSTKIMQISY